MTTERNSGKGALEVVTAIAQIGAAVAQTVQDAMAAGDVSTTDQLTVKLDPAQRILARTIALEHAQRAKAAAELGGKS